MNVDHPIPRQLKSLLTGDETLKSALQQYLKTVGYVLVDNKLPFFPDYTDHGWNHIQDVLATAVRLIPDELLKGDFLTAQDACVLVLGTALHDLAMHLRENGFLALIGGNWPPPGVKSPVTFDPGRFGDKLWPTLWQEYLVEAKRFDDRTLTRIFGPNPVHRDENDTEELKWSVREPGNDHRSWDKYQLLLIGEFIRRHHARLAHEFALFGFPGIPGNQLAPLTALLKDEYSDLSDIAGQIGRSHGMPLRSAADALAKAFPRQPRPAGCLPVYHMALLRVADYLQIEHRRTPAILLSLRNPPSKASVEVYWFSVKWSLGSLAQASVRRAPMHEFLEAWGNAPNWRWGVGRGAFGPAALTVPFSPSQTRPAIPGGSHSCVARFRFTGWS